MEAGMDQRLLDGIAAARARRLDDARALLQEAVAATPDDARAWFWFAVVSSSADTAMSHLRRALTLTPAYQAARDALAKLLVAQASRMANRDLKAARTLIDEATALAPELDAVWLAVASLADNRAARLDALRRAYALVKAPATRDRLRQVLLQDAAAAAAKDAGLARRLLREFAVLSPDDARVWRALVQLAETPAAALADIRQLVALAPAFSEGPTYLRNALIADARVHAAAHDRPAARERWREASTLDDRDIEVWIGLAESTDDPTEERQALDRAFAIDPDDPRVVAAIASTAAVPNPPEALPEDDGTTDPWAAFAAPSDPFERFNSPPVSAATAAPTPRPVAEEPPSTIADATAGEPPRTVMVIDDSPTIRKILSLTLERAGYSVIAESGGESAISRLSERLPDVILLDIAMPGIDGYETCKRIRGDSRTAHLPILMLSGKDALFDKVKGHMAGATEYLTKPFETDTVLAAIAGACLVPQR